MSSVLVFGHSHIHAIHQAAKLRADAGVSNWSFRPTYIICRDWQVSDGELFGPDGDEYSFSPRLVELLRDDIKNNGHRAIISVVGGNAHNVLSLIETDDPFDLILPDEPDLPLDENRRLLSFNYTREALHIRTVPNIQMLQALSRFAAAMELPLFHLESPPAIGDDKHVNDKLDPYFREHFQGRKAVPRWVRYKMWRLYTDIMRNECLLLGIPFVACPEGSRDSEGFLRSEAFPDNATHANPWYGALVLNQIEKLLPQEA